METVRLIPKVSSTCFPLQFPATCWQLYHILCLCFSYSLC